MTEFAKISVIVPVYRVEAYLCQCLDSIINQTYRNLEILLVDDGSPDNSGVICDEYAEKDDRIIVIHQENAGISAARNAALDIATGDYISFVDSDDWIDPEMYATLLQKMQAAQADVGICGYVEECPNLSRKKPGGKKRLNREDSMKQLLQLRSIHPHVWDKLWKQEVFRDVRFPVGMLYEDVATIHKPLERANRVVCMPDCFYHYRINPSGVMADVRFSSRLDFLKAAQMRHQDLADRWPSLAKWTEYGYIEAAVRVWTVYYRNPREIRQQYLPQMQQIAAYAKPRIRDAIRNSGMGVFGRLILRLIPYPVWWSFALAWLISWGYKLLRGRYL